MVTKKGQKQLAEAIVVIAILALVANQFGYVTIPGVPKFQSTQTPSNQPTQAPSSAADYMAGVGMFNVRCSAQETTDPTTSYVISPTGSANIAIYWMKYEGGQWIMGPSGDNVYFDLKPADNGYGWIAVVVLSGQTQYVDYNKIKSSDPYITNVVYTDVTGDGKKEFVFQYDFKNHAIPSSGYPVVWFYCYLSAQDTAFTGINTLSNSTAIGTSTVTKYYDYSLSLSAEKKTIAIYAIELKATTTDLTKVKLQKMQIPSLGYVDVSAFTKLTTSTDIRWTYTFSNGEFNNALYLSRFPSAANKWDMQTQIEFTLSGGDNILITLTVYYLAAQTEAGATKTSTFYAQAS